MSKKEEFMDALRHYLNDFSDSEREDILYDYEEHFRIGIESGKSEDELIKELGSPRDIAAQYKTSEDETEFDSHDRRESIGGSIVIFIALLFFNLLFGIWFFVAIGAILIGVTCGCIGIFVAGIGCIACVLIYPIFPQYIDISPQIPHAAVFFAGIGTIALGILFCIGMFYVLRFFGRYFVKYVKWNIRTIRGE